MNNNQKLQDDVEQALKWEPLLVGSEIAVFSSDGTVTLMGNVDTWAKKKVAERACKSVKGVEALIEKIEVVFVANGKKSDSAIIKEVRKALNECHEVENGLIRFQIEDGQLKLEGTVKSYAQKLYVISCIENIAGIKTLIDLINIKSDTEDDVERLGIEEALVRNWAIHNEYINVAVFGNTVTLTGVVHSIFQKDEAERMAWKAPGVWNVHNDLAIDPKP